MKLVFRSEKVSDIERVYALVCDAFGQDDEAKLIERLRDQGALTFSLLAELEDTGELVGHLAFSPVLVQESLEHSDTAVNPQAKSWQALGLAPVSVKKHVQHLGVGSGIINFWFDEYADAFFNAVFLLGNPDYYRRFSFERALDYGFCCQYPDAEHAFQVRELSPGFLKKASGQVYYHGAFTGL